MFMHINCENSFTSLSEERALINNPQNYKKKLKIYDLFIDFIKLPHCNECIHEQKVVC